MIGRRQKDNCQRDFDPDAADDVDVRAEQRSFQVKADKKSEDEDRAASKTVEEPPRTTAFM